MALTLLQKNTAQDGLQGGGLLGGLSWVYKWRYSPTPGLLRVVV